MATKKSFEVVPFDPAEYLKDEKSIAAFLNASREMNDPAVLLNALSTVARARSMTELAEASGLGRESLYKALRPGAQPRYDTVMRVMEALGVEMVFRAKRQPAVAKQTGAVTHASKKKAVEVVRSKVAAKPRFRAPSTEACAIANGKEFERTARQPAVQSSRQQKTR
jgi:probable addiction module antidote protein